MSTDKMERGRNPKVYADRDSAGVYREQVMKVPPAAQCFVQAATGSIGAAALTATVAHDSVTTPYITGFEITALGATALTNVKVTVAGLVGSTTLTYDMQIPAGATAIATPLSVQFPEPIPAKDAATDIVVTLPQAAGNTSANINVHGFRV